MTNLSSTAEALLDRAAWLAEEIACGTLIGETPAEAARRLAQLVRDLAAEVEARRDERPAPPPVVRRFGPDRSVAPGALAAGVLVQRYTMEVNGGRRLTAEMPCCDRRVPLAPDVDEPLVAACRSCGWVYAIRLDPEDYGGYLAELRIQAHATMPARQRVRRPGGVSGGRQSS